MANHKSPAKTIRSHRRLIEFLKSKTTTPSVTKRSPSICPQMTICILPEQPQLTAINLQQIDINPKKIYHPTILNTRDTMFKKHPDHLSQEEILKFNHYRCWKSEIGWVKEMFDICKSKIICPENKL